MGASGWEYRTAYRGSLERTLSELQLQVLAGGDYLWPWENFDPEYLADLDESEIAPRPTDLQGLAAAKNLDDFWDQGTHTILDVDHLSKNPEFAAITPLTTAELVAIFGTDHPSTEDFERVYQPGPSGALGDACGERGRGRCLSLYTAGQESPVEVYFWGFSGD